MPVIKPTIDNKNTTSACGGLPYYLAMNLFTKHRLQRPWIEYLLLTLLYGLVLSLRIRSALFDSHPTLAITCLTTPDMQVFGKCFRIFQ